ncbi:MAG TPA: iron-containing redox enzyme family protein, partial [Leptospiraceae bacterium]|nr:iron-containing redox enzyme family protein [Leptospiraceae bacterium]
GLGALGPANEYLLKLEYGKMYQAYRKLASEKTLPRAHFFEVNLHADESHSAKMFRLIENSVKTDADFSQVMEGNLSALEARKLFYEGLKRKEG